MTGNPRRGRFPPKLLRSENADLKFSANNGETDANKKPAEQREHRRQREAEDNAVKGKQRRLLLQRPQTCIRHRQNTTCNYHANETDEEREHRLPTLQENATNRIPNESDVEKFTVKIILQ